MSSNCAKAILLTACLGVAQSCASPLAPSQQGATLSRYLKLDDEHRRELCPAGTEEEFNRLLKRHRGLGYWVPELEGDVDFVTLEKLMPELEHKLRWIQEKRARLQKRKKLPDPSKLTALVEARIHELLLHKQAWETSPEGPVRKKAAAASAAGLVNLRREWDEMLAKVSFLTNYAYPVDHLKNRKVYDEFREKPGSAAKQIANYAFFYRRLLEDGAYNPDHTGSDSWLRTTLDTLKIQLERPTAFLEEDLRYDLDYALGRLKKELERGKPALVDRLGEWEERTARTLQFYRDLIEPENRQKSRALIRERNQATLQLKEWVFTRQAKSWNWWRRQDENMKALHAIETILYNEVGDVDAEEALERLDVAQVVVNRSQVPFYRSLDPAQDLYPYLRASLSDKDIQAEGWLNVLYRQGEFSFTYYYMPGAVKAFCPDLSRTGKRLQKENLEIAFALLREPRKDFPALRYFSRASMPGRINMASVWEDYQEFPERAGLLAPDQGMLREKLAKNELRYLYRFQDPRGQEYLAYALENKIYVAKRHEGLWLFYSWRNPHYFTYFTLIPKASVAR